MINCVAVDDEPLALKQIVAYAELTPFLNLTGKFHNAFLCVDFLNENEVDLIFLDINMPDISGLDFIKSLENPPKVIFTTAYSEYAIEGYKVNAIDYLLKPIEYEDFLRASQKARELLEREKGFTPEVNNNDDYLFIKSGQRYVRIKFDEIKYMEAQKEYVKIHLINAEPVSSLVRLKNIEQALPPKKFMRIHRSFVVNLDHIITVERSRIIYSEKEFITVSDTYWDEFKAYLDEKFFG